MSSGKYRVHLTLIIISAFHAYRTNLRSVYGGSGSGCLKMTRPSVSIRAVPTTDHHFSFSLMVRGGHSLRNFDWSGSTLHISASSLQNQLTRVQYLRDFIDFSSSDAAALMTDHYFSFSLIVSRVIPEKLEAFDRSRPALFSIRTR